MNINSTSSQPPVGTIVLPTANPNAGKQTLGQNDFMKLLSAQLSAQDPMNPMKDTEFVAQMANFSALEQMRVLSQSFTEFADEQRTAVLPGYLGREVTVTDQELGEVKGVVTGVVIESGSPAIVVNGRNYDPKRIVALSLPSTTTPTGSAQ